MSGTILLGIDGSAGGERALSYAQSLARVGGAEVLVVYVIEWSPYSFNTPQENEQRHRRREEELQTAEQQVLAPAIAQLAAAGISARGLVRHGHAAKTLAQLAKDQAASAIVIGRQGQSGLKGMLFGSVAGSLVQLAAVPVTVVP